jgi:hypothetical protein
MRASSLIVIARQFQSLFSARDQYRPVHFRLLQVIRTSEHSFSSVYTIHVSA